MADGRDNVSMQPVPMSNVRSKKAGQDLWSCCKHYRNSNKIYFYIKVWLRNWKANIDNEKSWDHDNLHDEENKQHYSSLEKEVSENYYKWGYGIKREGDSTKTNHNVNLIE
jgi:hypothetical protein